MLAWNKGLLPLDLQKQLRVFYPDQTQQQSTLVLFVTKTNDIRNE